MTNENLWGSGLVARGRKGFKYYEANWCITTSVLGHHRSNVDYPKLLSWYCRAFRYE